MADHVYVHEENQDIAKRVVYLAQLLHYIVCHNSSSARAGNFDGYHRYVVLDPTLSQDTSIRSKACIFYEEARFSRFFKPSIKGEKEALKRLWKRLNQLCLQKWQNGIDHHCEELERKNNESRTRF